MAFTSEAAAAGTPRLRYLRLQGDVSMFALMQLPSVRGVGELVVDFKASLAIRDTFSADAVRAWLVGLAVVPKVSLLLHSEEQQVCALQHTLAAGLLVSQPTFVGPSLL